MHFKMHQKQDASIIHNTYNIFVKNPPVLCLYVKNVYKYIHINIQDLVFMLLYTVDSIESTLT
jgi:hypothetical protein